jgi:hypothetical protein
VPLVSLVYLLPSGSLATSLGGTDNGLFSIDSSTGVVSRAGTLTAGTTYNVAYLVFDTATGLISGRRDTITATAATSAGLAMTQLTAGRVYQRSTKTGGGAGKGAGSIAVPITLQAAASTIEYRLRDALANGNPTLQDWTTAATGVAATATSVTCSGVPADAKQYLLDLRANNDNAQIALGTSAVMMGRIIAASGQSQMVRQFAKIPAYTGTNASLGVTISPYSAVYATYTDTGAANGGLATPAWAPPADGGNYGSVFAAEFLRQQVASSGVACAWVGNSVGSTAIAAWAPGSTNNVNLRAVLDAVGGFEAFYWHQGGDDAGAGTSKATYKSGLDAMFADIAQHNAIWGTNFTKLLTAMATRLSGGAGTTAAVTMIRQAAKEWAATNSGIYVEPHDLNLEDAVHQGQPGNIVLAQHAHRALATNDVGPTFGTPTLSTDNTTLYIPVNLPSGATGLVLTGNAKSRLSVFPTGTQANPLTISTLTYDGTNKRLVAALSAAPTTNVDVYAFLHPDPSGTTANADMIRDDRTDGDGIAVGRSLEPTTTGPVTATVNVAAPAGPPVGTVIWINAYDSRGLGNSPTTDTRFNNLDQASYTAPNTLALKDASGNATALAASLTTGMNSGNSQSTTEGASVVPKSVADTFLFIDKANSTGNGTSTQGKLAVTGIAAGTTWTVELFGLRNNVATRLENFTVGASTQAANIGTGGTPSAWTATFTGVQPTAGEIDALFAQNGSENFAYLNAARLTRTA